MRREAVTKGVAAGRLGDPGRPNRRSDSRLQAALIAMVATDLAAARIGGESSSRKDVLPDPLAIGVLILAFERKRQIYRSIAMFHILIKYSPHQLQMNLKRRGQRVRQHRHTIVHALAITNNELVLREIQILHA